MIRGRNVYKVKESHIAISGRRAGRVHSYEAGEVKRCFEESEKTGFICPICNTIIDFSRAAILPTDEEYICPNDPSMPSIDRINNDLTYLWGNGRLVHLGCNCARNTTSMAFTIDKSIWPIPNKAVALTWSPSTKEVETIYQNNVDILRADGMVKRLIKIATIQKQKQLLNNQMNAFTAKYVEDVMLTKMPDNEFQALFAKMDEINKRKSELREQDDKLDEIAKLRGYANYKEMAEAICAKGSGKKTKSEKKPSVKNCSRGQPQIDLCYKAIVENGTQVDEPFVLSQVAEILGPKVFPNHKEPAKYFGQTIAAGVSAGTIAIKRGMLRGIYARTA